MIMKITEFFRNLPKNNVKSVETKLKSNMNAMATLAMNACMLLKSKSFTCA